MTRPCRWIALLGVSAFAVLLLSATPTPGEERERKRFCRGERATMVGGPEDDGGYGTHRDDVIVAGRGDDEVFSLKGDDLVCLGPGDDIVEAHVGEDRVFGGPGSDELDGGGETDVLHGQSGNDRLAGNYGGRDRCLGGRPSDDRRPDANWPEIEDLNGDLFIRRTCERHRGALGHHFLTTP